jgi:hypothetical protein
MLKYDQISQKYTYQKVNVSLEYHLTALKKIKKVEMIDKQWKS